MVNASKTSTAITTTPMMTSERSNGVAAKAAASVGGSRKPMASNRIYGDSSTAAVTYGECKKRASGAHSSSSSSSTSSLAHIASNNNNNNNNSYSDSSNQQQQRLVFGLNARTNRHKHNEYAAERSQRLASSSTTNATDTSKVTDNNKLVSSGNKSVESGSADPKPSPTIVGKGTEVANERRRKSGVVQRPATEDIVCVLRGPSPVKSAFEPCVSFGQQRNKPQQEQQYGKAADQHRARPTATSDQRSLIDNQTGLATNNNSLQRVTVRESKDVNISNSNPSISRSTSTTGANETMVSEKTNSSTNGTETAKRRVVRHRSPSGRTRTGSDSEAEPTNSNSIGMNSSISSGSKSSSSNSSSSSSSTNAVNSSSKISSTNGAAADAAEKDKQAKSTTTGTTSGTGSSGGATKPRTQFNIPPPPPMQPSLGFGHRSGSASGSKGGSVVSYAKARIYERPNTLVRDDSQSSSGSSGSGNQVDSLQMRDSLLVPKSISCGFKPPKQVNVSQARAKWEGGEPFAKCKSRQRLAAQASKRLLPGTWSMTSVVATQQMQLQQALAQSSGYSRSSSSIDQSVKLLTRGSVFERVQQFEKVPSSTTISPGSTSPPISASISSETLSTSIASSSPLSPSSSTESFASTLSSASSLSSVTSKSSSAAPSVEASGDAEASITIDRSKEQTKTVTSGSLTPEIQTLKSTGEDDKEQWPTSKRAQYRMKVSRLQQEQLRQWRQSESPLQQQQQMQQQMPTSNRRLSLRRRSLAGQQSSISSSNPLSQLIPKFYHPSGLKPNTYKLELQKRNIAACFDKFPERCALLIPDDVNARRQFHSIAVACGYSEYFKVPLQTYVRCCLESGILADNNSNDQKTNPNANGKPRVGIQRKQSTIAFNAMTNGTNVGKDQISQQKIHVKSAHTTSVGGPAAKTAFGRATSIDSSTPPMPADRLRRASISIDKSNAVDCDQFFTCWRRLLETAHDLPAQFVHILTFGQRDYLLPDDFVPMVQSIIDDHPGLKFLRAAPDFHMRYIQTVIARIYYSVNKSWTGRITLSELRRSNLLPVLTVLSQEDDINIVTDYFSYEHFYVIYCKFWNLDQDHDLLIGREDLARHNDASISSRIIERIFSGAVSKQIQKTGKMTYTDFVWFLLAEEDKKHPRSVEYWFRLMDIDGDGYISIYEMEYFYYEQMKRLELMNIEALPFIDTACQLLDLVNPKEKNKISLSDLKRNKMATIFFDTFINLEKYLEHESREFVSSRDVIQDGVVVSDWERYASEEYESLVTEESSV